MKDNINIINLTLAQEIEPSLKNQYNLYKNQVSALKKEYEQLKQQGKIISKTLEDLKNRNLIDNHISTMMQLVNEYTPHRGRLRKNETDIKFISEYLKKIEQVSKESLQVIFNVRKMFTGQEFDIYLEEKGKIYSFSVDDIQNHIGSIIPTYGLSLETMIKNMSKNTKSFASALTKLGFTLKKIDGDTEKRGLKKYQDFVAYHITKNKIIMSESRQLEASVYLWTRKDKVDFNNNSERHSLHAMLGRYIKHGGTSDNITMYKLGDAIKETNKEFKNIEIKRHDGTISLTMIANGIKDLDNAMQKEGKNALNSLIKFFTVKEQRLSSPIDKQAQKKIIDSIDDMCKKLDII